MLHLPAQASAAAEEHWVSTWGCGPQLVEPRNLPPAPLANHTLRQFVHVSVGGKRLRVRLSNAYGTDSVAVNSAHIALSAGAGSATNAEINAATDTALTFRGRPSVNIPPGMEVLSDPIEFELPPLTNLAVSLYFGNVSATTLNGHPGSRTTSFINPSNAVDERAMIGAARTPHWYVITGIEVADGEHAQAVVVLGDSITDGRGSTTDGNDRWPDTLARRLFTNAATTEVAVINMGIGGNGVFGGLGPSALARFDRDVLAQSGARWLIVFEGVNDIGGANSTRSPALATNLVNAYSQFAEKAHARHMLVYGATITPFGGSFYYSPAHEATRQTVNAWIRTNHLYDGVIDFDAAARDPAKLTNLGADYNSGDGLHLNPAGYRAMADAIDLALFAR